MLIPCWQLSQLSLTQTSYLCFWFIYPTAYLTSPFRCFMSISNLTCPKWISCFLFRLPSLVTSTPISPVGGNQELSLYLAPLTPFLHLQMLPYLPPPKCILAAHFFPSPLLSPYFKPPNLSPGCCDMLLPGLPISTFASLQFISLYSKSDQLKR